MTHFARLRFDARRLSLLTQIFKPLQAETAHIYLAFTVAWGHAVAGDRCRTRFYANADSASRTSILVGFKFDLFRRRSQAQTEHGGGE